MISGISNMFPSFLIGARAPIVEPKQESITQIALNRIREFSNAISESVLNFSAYVILGGLAAIFSAVSFVFDAFDPEPNRSALEKTIHKVILVITVVLVSIRLIFEATLTATMDAIMFHVPVAGYALGAIACLWQLGIIVQAEYNNSYV